MPSLTGCYLAALIGGETPDLGLLATNRLTSIPFYPFREPTVRTVAGWHQLLDAIGR
jgi:gamma-glutamylputrescine oxidase